MPKITAVVVGTGGMARWHIRSMLEMRRSTTLVGFVEPSEVARDVTREIFAEHNLICLPFFDTIKALVKSQGSPDAAFICTPHK